MKKITIKNLALSIALIFSFSLQASLLDTCVYRIKCAQDSKECPALRDALNKLTWVKRKAVMWTIGNPNLQPETPKEEIQEYVITFIEKKQLTSEVCPFPLVFGGDAKEKIDSNPACAEVWERWKKVMCRGSEPFSAQLQERFIKKKIHNNNNNKDSCRRF